LNTSVWIRDSAVFYKHFRVSRDSFKALDIVDFKLCGVSIDETCIKGVSK